MIEDHGLTYKIIGFGYDIYNRIRYGHKEKIYQAAFEELLKKNHVKYQKELYCPIKFETKIIGKYYLDFLINDKLIVEMKVAEDFYPKHFKQVINYLKAKNLELALIILITKHQIKIKRIINSCNL